MNHLLGSLFFLMLIVGCNNVEVNSAVNPISEKIGLDNGFYFLNGADAKYRVKRKDKNEVYVLNPYPIFGKNDYEEVGIIAEENGKFSLAVSLKESKSYKWNQVLESVAHYVGYVYNNELRGLIKIKGDNVRDDVFLNCVGDTQKEAENMIMTLLN